MCLFRTTPDESDSDSDRDSAARCLLRSESRMRLFVVVCVGRLVALLAQWSGPIDAVAKPGETRAPGFEGSHAVAGASKGQAAHVEQEPRCVEVHDGRFSASLQHGVRR